ncbi:MAG: MFS transporter [Clostridiales bacterium]
MKKLYSIIISSGLFFLFFFAIGNFMPILSLYLKDILKFSNQQTGLIMSLVLVSSLLSPLLSSFVIDRIITKKWLLFICSLFSAGLLFNLSYCKSYFAFMISYVLYIVFSSPVLGIIIALALDKIDNKDNFGKVRLFGTLGWIFASMFFGFFWIDRFGYDRLGDSFIFAGISFLCFAIFALTLRDDKLKDRLVVNKRKSILNLIPRDALKDLSKPNLRSALLLYFIGYLLESINIFGASPFLKQIGVNPTFL